MSGILGRLDRLADQLNTLALEEWEAHNRAADEGQADSAEVHGAAAEAYDFARAQVRIIASGGVA